MRRSLSLMLKVVKGRIVRKQNTKQKQTLRNQIYEEEGKSSQTGIMLCGYTTALQATLMINTANMAIELYRMGLENTDFIRYGELLSLHLLSSRFSTANINLACKRSAYEPFCLKGRAF